MSAQTEPGWHLVRFTITALSPLSCGAGDGIAADNIIARDANGLPMIPGATLQGLLRQACPAETRVALFGTMATKSGDARGEGTSKSAGKAGRILCSNGIVHGSDDQAVMPFAQVGGDEMLKRLSRAAPLKRDHVRLDHRHGADPAGKFNRAAVPKGTRFSFEWMMFGKAGEADLFAELLAPLASPWFRIGSSGGRGYGKVTLDSVSHKFFPFDSAKEYRTLRQSSLSNQKGLAPIKISQPREALCITLSLEPVNAWRSGQHGIHFEGDAVPNEEKNAPDLTPTREAYIAWNNGQGQWLDPQTSDKKAYVLPGSSLRGPLAHRTLYHWNRLSAQLIDVDSAQDSDVAAFAERSTVVQEFLGFAREGSGGEEGGRASALLFEDVDITVIEVIETPHVKLDRFTGGAMPRALYSEQLIETARLETRIFLRSQSGAPDDKVLEAFLEALRDLCVGRLSLGAKSYGFFKGAVRFSGGGAEPWQQCWDRLCGGEP